MNFIADEHIPPALVKALRGEGYNVVEIDETVGLGTDDDPILEYAVEQRRVVISEDSDFRGRIRRSIWIITRNFSRVIQQRPGNGSDRRPAY